jgi:hypothetical protein
MGHRNCSVCGTESEEGKKFCETCGTPLNPSTAPVPAQPLVSASQDPVVLPPVDTSPPRGTASRSTVKIIIGSLIILVIAAAFLFFILPGIHSGSGRNSEGVDSPARTPSSATTIPVTPELTTPTPTPTPDPFPNALRLKEALPFGEGTFESEGTVYRFWMNNTYHWHNDMDNKYYVQKPRSGNKYLFVFVNVFNKGETRIWPPASGNIRVYFEKKYYDQDPTHYLPDKSSDRKATAIEVMEVQFFPKYFGTEYVEDYGYSHGSQLAYLYPGKSNAIDGYLVYEVPASLSPEKAYVEIVFNGKTTGVWKLG